MATERFFNPLNEVNPSFTPAVSRAGLIKGERMSTNVATAKLGVDALVGFQKTSALTGVEADITKAIEDYQSQSPTYQALVNKNISNIQSEIETTRSNTRLSQNDIDSQIKNLNSQLNNEYSKLTRARQQGSITPLELETRIDQLTREKVNQNPAFRKEIISHAAQTKDLLGISTIVAKDVSYYNELAAQEKENRTRLMNEANQYHLNLNDNKYKNLDGSLNPVAVNYDINDKRGKIATFEALQLANNQQTELLKKDLKESIDNKSITDAFEGGLLTLQIELGKKWDDPNLTIEQKVKASDLVLSTELFKVQNLVAKYGNAPELSDLKETYKNLVQDIKNNYKNIGSGKEMKDFLENRLGIIKANQGLNLNAVVNTTQMNFMADTVQKMGPYGLSQTFKDKLGQDLILISDAFSQANYTGILNINPQVEDRQFKKLPNGKFPAGIALDSARDSVLKGDPSFELQSLNINNYENMLKMYTIRAARPTVDKNESLFLTDKVMLDLGSSAIKNKNIQYSDSFKSDIDATITTYAKRVGEEITNLRGKPDGVVLGLNPDGTLKATADPTIKVTNTSLQQSYINRFNNIIVNRINNSMKAYATIHGSTTQSISAQFIRNYYGSVFSNLNKAPGSTDTFTDKQKEANAIIGE